MTDNGTAFTAKKRQQFAAQKNIKWDFNVKEAPWFGAFGEKLVRSVKITGRSNLTFVELQILFCKIENILNSRPLATLFDDDGEQILTSNHLLFGRQLACSNDDDNHFIQSNWDFSRRDMYINVVLPYFWARWSSEKLLPLREFYTQYKLLHSYQV